MKKIEQITDEFVLAIDPALSITGYAIIDINTFKPIYINEFTTSNKNSDDFRINEIITKLFSVAAQYPIKYVVLEDGYLGVNPRTTIQLATLRGAIIGTFNMCKYYVYHMLTTEITKTINCGGNAKKEDIANAIIVMYPELLNIIGPYSDKHNKDKTSDMYDAFATGLAFCINHRNSVSKNETI